MKLETLALHSSCLIDSNIKASVAPIYQTTSFIFDDAQHGADLFSLHRQGYAYSRMANPTNTVLEARLNAMEGGVGAVAVASGMAAISCAVQCITAVGDNIVSTSQLYGGTYHYFNSGLQRQGVEVRMASCNDIEGLERLIDQNTKLIFCESISNPCGDIPDIRQLATIAKKHGILLIVDNTVATPYLCKPLDYGAHVVVHSLTKYIGGHGAALGGVIVDLGNFDWSRNYARYPSLSEPDTSHNDIVFSDAFGKAAYIERCRLVSSENTGAALSPHSAFLLLQGLETLGLRMERHCKNALAVARYLQSHSQVAVVNYPALTENVYFDQCKDLMGGKASGVVSFHIRGGISKGSKFIDSLKMILKSVSLGETRSLACQPITTTHSKLSNPALVSAGVTENLVRLSVGIEHIDDILFDIEQALDAVSKC